MQRHRVGGHVAVQRLERHIALHQGVLGEVDRAEPTLAEQLDDLVAVDRAPDEPRVIGRAAARRALGDRLAGAASLRHRVHLLEADPFGDRLARYVVALLRLTARGFVELEL